MFETGGGIEMSKGKCKIVVLLVVWSVNLPIQGVD